MQFLEKWLKNFLSVCGFSYYIFYVITEFRILQSLRHISSSSARNSSKKKCATAKVLFTANFAIKYFLITNFILQDKLDTEKGIMAKMRK